MFGILIITAMAIESFYTVWSCGREVCGESVH